MTVPVFIELGMFGSGNSFVQAAPLRTVRAIGGSCPPPKRMPSKSPEEAVLITFDFSAYALPSGVTIDSAHFGAALFNGIDSSTTLEAGTPTISANGLMVSGLFSEGSDQCNYYIECLATCSDGEVLALLARQSIIDLVPTVIMIPVALVMVPFCLMSAN